MEVIAGAGLHTGVWSCVAAWRCSEGCGTNDTYEYLTPDHSMPLGVTDSLKFPLVDALGVVRRCWLQDGGVDHCVETTTEYCVLLQCALAELRLAAGEGVAIVQVASAVLLVANRYRPVPPLFEACC